jgi:hypothetical protein
MVVTSFSLGRVNFLCRSCVETNAQRVGGFQRMRPADVGLISTQSPGGHADSSNSGAGVMCQDTTTEDDSSN